MKLTKILRNIPLDRSTVTGLLAGLPLLVLAIGSLINPRPNTPSSGLDMGRPVSFVLEVDGNSCADQADQLKSSVDESTK